MSKSLQMSLFCSSATSFIVCLVMCMLSRYDNYGGDWASYNFTAVQQWIQSFNVCELVSFWSTPTGVYLIILIKLVSCPSICPSIHKEFPDSNEIWCVCRSQWVMHDGMPYDPIQGQGHDTLKVWNSAIFKTYLQLLFSMWAGKWLSLVKLEDSV